MNAEKIEDIVRLAETVGHVFVATADAVGMPHIAVAGKMEAAHGGCVTVTEWFCPGTMANLSENACVSIVVWAKDSDMGYQLLGKMNKIHDLDVLDGYAPGREGSPPLPQVEKQLRVKVEKIIDFKLGPHSDEEISETS